MRWVVTGAGGMLGTELVSLLAGRDVCALSRTDLDVTNPDAVEEVVTAADVVVNCAAWTQVDDAESAEDQAFAVNAVGAVNLARVCGRRGARLVQLSTDYVFDGEADRPYAEDAPVSPCSAYGRTKAAGEWGVRAELPEGSYVVRTAWLYGAAGANFVRTVAHLATEHDQFDVVGDQHGQPTWSRDVAALIVALVEAHAPAGIYHATSAGATTWCGLARAVLELLGLDPARVRATTSQAFVRAAPRPGWSVLGHEAWAKVGLDPIGHWRERLEAAWPTLRGSL